MELDKIMGLLVLSALMMFLLFYASRGKLPRNEEYSRLQWWITYFVVYVMFTAVLWGLCVAMYYGIWLIVR